MFLRAGLFCFCALLLAGGLRAAIDSNPALYNRVEIAPTKTSIYVGSVTMTMPTFQRKGTTYEADYTAKVFPYFFYNEQGRLYIEVPDATLRHLERGETIQFEGRGVRSDGVTRHVEGRAVPTSPSTGTIKVRVFVTRKIQLIFNTTYKFVGQSAEKAAVKK